MNDFKLFNTCSTEMSILGFVDKYDPSYSSFSYCFFVYVSCTLLVLVVRPDRVGFDVLTTVTERMRFHVL
jgi:hypothetical protein